MICFEFLISDFEFPDKLKINWSKILFGSSLSVLGVLMLKGHGGNIYDLAAMLDCDPFEIIDMSSNVNPLGPLPGLVEELKRNIHRTTALPEVDAEGTVLAFAQRYNLDPQQVIAGNGTTVLIFSIPQVLDAKRALIFGPTYSDYADACSLHNVRFDYLMTRESSSFQPDMDAADQKVKGYDLVFICNPNNPTGTLIPLEDLLQLCRSHADTFFVIDESYLPFVDNSDQMSMVRSGLSNVLILNSMSKIFRIPGLRIGFLISSDQTIQKFKPFLLPWNVNSLAQVAVDYLMRQRREVDAFIENTVLFLATESKLMSKAFQDVPAITLFPSKTSFLLSRLHGKTTADDLCSHLAAAGILIRNCSNFTGLSQQFIRISLKTSKINRQLAEKTLKYLHKL